MPVDHVIRPPLPWRTDLPEQTECGRDLADVHQAIPYAEFHEAATEWNDLVRSFRKAQLPVPTSVARPNICKICWDKITHHPAWHHNPIRRLWRDLDDFGYYPHGPAAERAAREMWALIRLADRHRAEFNALVAEMSLGYRRD